MGVDRELDAGAAELELPESYWWPEPITHEEFEALAPEKLELVDGFLLGGPDDEAAREARRRLLALLLRNCGLEEAVWLADPFHWREALERQGMGW